MQIIHVIPISRGIHTETLTYFSVQPLVAGSLVRALYNRRKIVGLVVRTEDASQVKGDVKHLYFSLKNIIDVVPDFSLPQALVEATEILANRYNVPQHSILSQVIPKSYLTFLQSGVTTPEHPAVKDSPSFFMQALQDAYPRRLEIYRTLIRESFSKQRSLVICAPDQATIEDIAYQVSRGIEEKIVVLHSGLSKKKLEAAFLKIHKEGHETQAIITTPYFICAAAVTHPNLYILDHETSNAYVTNKTPYINLKDLIIEMTKQSQSHCLVADSLLSLETLQGIAEQRIEPISAPSFRIRSQANVHLHTQSGKEKEEEKKVWSLFHPETLQAIAETQEQKEPMVFFVPRKGLATITTCNDCGHIHRCESCQTPLVLHTRGKRHYQCHYCRAKQTITDRCASCGGFKLELLGVTTESIREELQKLFPDTPSFIIDSTNTSTGKQIVTTLEEWHNSRSGFLIMTHLALPYIHEVPHLCIASIGSLLARSDFDSEESTLRLLTMLLERTSSSFHIQARDPENLIIMSLLKKNLSPWTEQEMRLREQFKYPPFTHLLHIHIPAFSSSAWQELLPTRMNYIQDFDPHIIEHNKKHKNLPTGAFLVLKIPRDTWRQYKKSSDNHLTRFVRTLPESYQIYLS